ncbi:MAG: CHASE3 domain-containing protein [Burkholderiales bacterium]
MKATPKVIASFAGAALLAALLAVSSLWAFMQIEGGFQARKNSHALIIRANKVLSELTEAETGQRGYALTADDAFLKRYLAVRDGIRDHLRELRPLTLDMAAHQHLDLLAPLVDAKLEHMSHIIELRRQGDGAATLAAVRSGKGRQLMDSISAEMGSFTAMEEGALARAETQFQGKMGWLFAVIAAAGLLTLLFALSFTYLVLRESGRRMENLVHFETRRLLEVQKETNKQQEKTNARLQISEERLAVTLSSIGDAVIAVDAQGRVTLLNPLAEGLTGWTQAQANGRPVEEIFRIVNQETRQPSTIPVMETLADGTIQGMANHTILIARDGSECAIADSCAPIHDRGGQVTGAVLVFRDVTSEYAARRALTESEERYRSLFNSIDEGFCIIELIYDEHGKPADWRYLEVNPSFERHTGIQDITGKRIRELAPDHEEYWFQTYGDVALTGIPIRFMNEAKSIDGRWFDLYAFRLGGPGSHKVAVIFTDITERKRVDRVLHDKSVELEEAKLAAEKANLAKSEFLSSMSHELRTPLNAILGFAQIMESSSPPPAPSQKRSIDQILKAGWFLLELINEILDLSLIEAGKLALSREAVCLSEVMRECQAMMEPQARKRGIGMTFPRFELPRFINADRTRIKQVLINLISNAIKYNVPGGRVTVECALIRSDSIRISVRDTGKGLAPEQLAQLFQPFNRLGKEYSAEEGTGIGLVVAKRLVELMGGVIGVESTAGAGSVFWIEMSVTRAPLLAVLEAGHVELARSLAPDGTPLRTILYVEDNPANLELVEQIIARRPDLRLLSAADAKAGIESARANLPEVILMDIHLPGISGTEAMKMLLADPTTARIPVIAISANAMPRDIELALEAGFFNYLTKPIKVKEFMDALGVALKLSQGAALTAVGGAVEGEPAC